jgi:excisionase family DNA binding protein
VSDRLSYSPAEAAAVLGLSRSGVYELVRAGRIKVVKVGARTLITRTALEAFLADAAAGVTAP